MNSVLIIIVYMGISWSPIYAIEYTSEADCIYHSKDYGPKPGGMRKAICVPRVEVEINKNQILTDEQIEAFDLDDTLTNVKKPWTGRAI